MATATTDTVPDAPTGLTAMVSGPNQIDLSWTAPEDDGGSTITGYRIQVSTTDTNAGSFSDLVADTTNSGTTYMHTAALTTGTTYHYRVAAINTITGTIGVPINYSAPATVTTFAVPDAPTGLTATASSDTQINLSWAAPADNGSSLITGYLIEVSTDGNAFSSLVANTASAATTYEHDLTTGETRYYRVSAINSAGISSTSDVAVATTFTVPDAPTDLTIARVGDGIEVTWAPPANTGGTPITRYRVQRSTGATTSFSNLPDNMTATFLNDEDVTLGTLHEYRVYAVNAVGDSVASTVVSLTPTGATSTAPGTVRNLEATHQLVTMASGDIIRSVRLSWGTPPDGGSPITSYEVQISSDGNTFTDLATVSLVTRYTHTSSESDPLIQGETRYYQVRAINDDGSGLFANVTIVIPVVAPTFGDNTISGRVYYSNDAIETLTLPEAAGGDGALTYSLSPALISGLTFDGTVTPPVISGTPTEVGDSEYTYTVTDVDGDTATLTFFITVISDDSLSFRYLTQPDLVYILGEAEQTFTLPQARGGSGTITYSITPDLPDGLALNSGTRVLSGQPTAIQGANSYTYEATDSDSNTVSLSFSITVLPAGSVRDTSPEFEVTEIPILTFINSAPITDVILPAATGGNAPLRYTVERISSLESASLFGMVFDANTRTLSGTPVINGLDRGDENLYTRLYKVTDNNGDTATLELRFTVRGDTPVTFIGGSSIPDQSYTQYVGIGTVSLLAAQGDAPLTYTLSSVSGLPAGLIFDTTLDPPAITGIPTVAQASERYTYRATDSDGDTNLVRFRLEVVASEGQLSFDGATISDHSYVVGDEIQIGLPRVATRRFPISTLVYTLAPDLPTGVVFDSREVSLSLSGIPEVALTSTEYTYTATETIGATTVPPVTASLTFNLEVVSPVFDSTQEDVTFPGNNIVELTLPAAKGVAPLTYAVTGLPAGFSFDADTRIISGTPAVTAIDTEVTYTVTDGDGRVDTLTFNLAVAAAEQLSFGDFVRIPDLSYIQGHEQQIILPQVVSRRISTSTLTYTIAPDLPTGLTFDGREANLSLSGTPSVAAASREYTYTVTETIGGTVPPGTASLTFNLEVLASPVFDSTQEDVTYPLGSNVELTLPAAKGVATLTYAVTGLPTGFSFDASTRIISNTSATTPVDSEVTYTVTDGGSRTATLTFNLAVASPVFNSIQEDVTYPRGNAVTLTLPAASGVATLTYAVTGLPTGFSFNAGTRVISGTSTATTADSEVTYTVTDGDSRTATVTFNMRFNPAILSFSDEAAIADQIYVQGLAVNIILPVAIGGVVPLTYSLSAALPLGLSFDAAARTISGTPSALAASTEYTYMVTDANGATASLTFDLEVRAAIALSFNRASIADQVYRQGVAVNVQLPIAAGGLSPLAYSIPETLPTGLALSTGGLLSGTPTVVTASTEYTYTVTDANGTTETLAFNIRVVPVPELSISGEALRSANENKEYTLTIESDINAPNLVEGGLPFYLQLTGASSTSTLSQGDNALNPPDTATPNSYRVIFPAGSRSVDITITSILTGAGSIDIIGVLLLSSPVSSEDFYTVSMTGQILVAITLTRDVTPPRPVINLQLDSVDDTQGDRRITVSWENPSDADYSHAMVGWRIQGTTSDFVNPIRVNSPAASATITVPTMEIYEIAVWTVDSSGNSLTQVNIGAGGPAISISASASSVAEGNTVTVTLMLNAAATREWVIPLRVTNVTARLGSDYTITDANRSLTFAIGDRTKMVTVTTISDGIDEEPETFRVGSPYGTEVTITITDLALPDPMVSLSLDNTTIAETGGTSTLTVTLSSEPAQDTNITIDTAGSAVIGAGNDYTLTPASVTFVAGTGSDPVTQTVTVAAVTDAIDELDETIILSVDADTIDGVDAGTPTSVTVTITDDDDAPVVSFSRTAVTVEENVTGGSVEVTLELTGTTSSRALVIPVSTANGSATAGSDYTALTNMNVTIAAGATTQTVSIDITNDDVDEADETFTVSIGTLPSGVTAGTSDQTVTVTIADDDVPAITISGGAAVTEGADATFTVTASPAPASALTVNLSADDGAGDFIDGTPPTTVTISTTGTATLSVPTDDDNTDEADGTITVTLASGTGYTIATPAPSATVTVNDNDVPEVTFNPTAVTVAEGAGTVSVTVELDISPVAQLIIPVSTANGSATAGEDYTALTSEMVTFAAGTRTLTQTVRISITNDNVDELDETFTVSFDTDSLPSGVTAGTDNTATVTIEDNDIPGVTFRVRAISLNEGSSVSINLEVRPSSGPARQLSIPLEITGSAQPADYTLRSNPVIIPAGQDSVNITIELADDTIDEVNETLILTLQEGDDWNVLDDGSNTRSRSSTVTINDNDAAPAVSFSSTAVTVEENVTGGSVEVTLELTGTTSSRELIIPVSTANGSATAGSDYTALTNMNVTIAAGATTQTVSIDITNDDVDEADETFTVSIGTLPSGVTAGTSDQTVTVTIADDDVPAITISGGAAVTEGADATFTVTASPAPASALTVNLSADDGAGDFIDGTPPTTVTISTTGTATLSVPTDDDNTDEDNGTITVTLASGTGYTIATPAPSATVTVNDNDDAPLATPAITITAVAATVTEGAAATFTVTASPAPANNLTVNLSADDGAGDFIDGTPPATVTISTTGTATLSVPTDDDNTDEADGTITVTLATGTGYTIATPAPSAMVTITDNDATPTVDFAATAVTVAEGDGTAVVTLELSGPSATALVIPVSTANGSATAGSDYTALTDMNVTIAAGATTQTVSIDITNDDVDEADETFTVSIGTLLSGVTAGTSDQTVTVTITDDDVPAITISGGAAVTEGADATFTVTASPAPASALTVNLSADDGAGDFIDGTPPTTVTISTTGTATLSVPTDDDNTDEDNGTITVTLATGTGYTIATPAPSATVTVNDNDDAPLATPAITITAVAATVTEGAAATFTVTASPAPANNLTVNLSADDGAGDFIDGTPPTTVTISTTGTATLSVPTDDDNTDEDNGTITVTLATGTGYTIATPAPSAMVTITDNDATPTVDFSATAVTVAEGDGTAVVTLGVVRSFGYGVGYSSEYSEWIGDRRLRLYGVDRHECHDSRRCDDPDSKHRYY